MPEIAWPTQLLRENPEWSGAIRQSQGIDSHYVCKE